MHTIFLILSIPVWLIGVGTLLVVFSGNVRFNGRRVSNDNLLVLPVFVFGALLIVYALELDFLDALPAILAVIVTNLISKKIFRFLGKRILDSKTPLVV